MVLQSWVCSLEQTDLADVPRRVRLMHSKHMKPGPMARLSEREIRLACEAPFALFCNHHADASKKDKPNPVAKMAAEKRIDHERTVLESTYHDIEKIAYEKSEDGFLLALCSMSRGVEALTKPPMFYLPDGMYGRIDVLERRDGKSAFGDHHYVVRMIITSKRIRPSHRLRAAFCSMMVGKIQARVPDTFYITNGEGETESYSYKDDEKKLQDMMGEARDIMGGAVPPAIYGSDPAPWSGYCDSMAMKMNDVSLISGVGAGKRDAMAGHGYHMVCDVADTTMDDLLKVPGVGEKTAAKYLDSAAAIITGKCVKKGDVRLPECSAEIFVDLEGLADGFDNVMSNYLIGALVRKNGKEKYHYFIADDGREDLMLKSFLDFMGSQSDYVAYHWGRYDKTQLAKLIERHGMEGCGSFRPDAMVDLLAVATRAFAFPTYGNGLKEIARWIGFDWRHKDVDAISSMELYLKYADDPESNADGMRLVLDYNEDDCTATMAVRDWLEANCLQDIACE